MLRKNPGLGGDTLIDVKLEQCMFPRPVCFASIQRTTSADTMLVLVVVAGRVSLAMVDQLDIQSEMSQNTN
jgi:hypothetical protein